LCYWVGFCNCKRKKILVDGWIEIEMKRVGVEKEKKEYGVRKPITIKKEKWVEYQL
jgi:hydroxymethylglutaryl-CoA reductase